MDDGPDGTGAVDATTTAPLDDTTGPDPDTTNSTTDASTDATQADTTAGSFDSTGSDSESDSESTEGPEPPTVCPVFLDTFDSPLIDSRWVQIPGTSVSAEDGELLINVTAAVNDEFARVQTLPEQNGLVGATARLEIGTPPPIEGVLLIMWVQPLNNEGRIAFQLQNQGDETLIQARITPEVGSPSIVDSDVWDPKTMQWLQLREDADMLYFETSPDGETFTTLFEMPTPIDVSSAFIGFVGHNNLQIGEDSEVSVRTFELMCGE